MDHEIRYGPDPGEVVGRAFGGAYDLLKKNAVPVAILIAYSAVGGIMFAVAAGPHGAALPGALDPARFQDPLTQSALLLGEALFFGVSYFAIAEAVRIIRPDFRMNVGRFLVFLVYQILSGILAGMATLLFLIPGIWVGVKITLTPYTYALTDRDNTALQDTWNMTTGYFWPTLGFLILLGLGIGVIGILVELAVIAAVANIPVTAVFMFPVAAAVVSWFLHVQALAHVHWTNGLVRRAGMIDTGRYELAVDTQDR